MLQIHTEGRVNRHCWDLLLFLKIYNLKKRTDLNYSTYRLAEKRRDSISSRDQQGDNLYKRSLSHLLLVWRTLQFFRREESTILYYIWNKYLFMIHSYQNKWQAFLYNTGIDMILKFHSWNIYLENHTTSALHLEKFLFVLFSCILSLEIKPFTFIELLRTRIDVLLSDGTAFISNEVYHEKSALAFANFNPIELIKQSISFQPCSLYCLLGVIKNLSFQKKSMRK